jgi:hypothetical protein
MHANHQQQQHDQQGATGAVLHSCQATCSACRQQPGRCCVAHAALGNSYHAGLLVEWRWLHSHSLGCCGAGCPLPTERLVQHTEGACSLLPQGEAAPGTAAGHVPSPHTQTHTVTKHHQAACYLLLGAHSYGSCCAELPTGTTAKISEMEPLSTRMALLPPHSSLRPKLGQSLDGAAAAGWSLAHQQQHCCCTSPTLTLRCP